MSKHTPGPWINDGNRTIRTNDNAIVAEAWSGICGLLDAPAFERAEAMRANAALIAAAPDLLEALKFIRRIWPANDNCAEALMADAAIAKAENQP